MEPWIGVDLDGTLAQYDKFKGPGIIGEPIPLMVERVQYWLREGKKVKIFTARISHPEQAAEALASIIPWCVKHIGQELEVTCYKDYGMVELWDDRCVQVAPNTGERESERVWKNGYQAGYVHGYDDVVNGRD